MQKQIHKILLTLRQEDWEALKRLAEQSDTPIAVEARRAVLKHLKEAR